MSPKPRSMQSRFILMEGATVSLALVLMAVALSISAVIRSQFSSGVEALQQQIALHSQIHDALDSTVLGFWRYYGSRNANLLREYQASETKLRGLTKRFGDIASSESQQDAVAELTRREETFLAQTDHLAAGAQNEKTDEPQFDEVVKSELRIRNIFNQMEVKEFESLRAATDKLAEYTQLLSALLLILGIFPVAAMLWFRRAHEEHIWAPFEQLYRMVREVQRGNLGVKGQVPDTVELGSLTTAFLGMASGLREARDSMEEKVRQRATQLEAAQKDLLRAAKLASLGQLVSGVAHEINNPLTSILGFSEVVLGHPGLPPPVRAQLQTVRNEAVRLKHLVANLSRISRRSPQRLHRLDLRTIPDRMIELRAYQLAANNVRLQYARPEDAIWVNGDADLLLQVTLQLVLNAEQSIRECREKGEIRLKCDVWNSRARMSVKDNGCGMPSEMRDHIFDPFFTTRPMWQGTGLGLSICHSIIEQHGGEVGVESEVGRGTTIRVLLPLVMDTESGGNGNASGEDREAGADESTKSAEPASWAIAERRFLVIDDEAEILNLVSVVLGKVGASVVTLQDSTQLDAALARGLFDAVLCDLKMPGQDGLSVLRTLRQKQPELARRFLLMTGNLADADKAQIELEGVPVLPKPFTLVRLRAVIGQILTPKN